MENTRKTQGNTWKTQAPTSLTLKVSNIQGSTVYTYIMVTFCFYFQQELKCRFRLYFHIGHPLMMK